MRDDNGNPFSNDLPMILECEFFIEDENRPRNVHACLLNLVENINLVLKHIGVKPVELRP